MAESNIALRAVRFGAFEADLHTCELRRDGVKLKLSGQPFQVLAILLEHAGQLVTREELQRRLWPDTFVDVDRNLNTAVNKIREVLGDSAENPRLIETLPRRGYRFIGFIEPASIQPRPVSPNMERSTGRRAYRSNWRVYASAFGIASILIALIWIVYSRFNPRSSQAEAQVLDASPFATLTGTQMFPAFSPDGSRIAFGWNGETGGTRAGFDLYVKAVGSETLLRLTHHPSASISAAWAPDGTQIAIHRIDGAETGIYLVPALGGPERKVHSTRIAAGLDHALPIAWSPDGKWIAFAESTNTDIETRIFLLSTTTWTRERIGSSSECQQEASPSFSHNGQLLAFACYLGNNESAVFTWQLKGTEVSKIVSVQGFVHGLAWSAGDQGIIYSQADAKSCILHEVSVRGKPLRRWAYEGQASFPTVSAGGHLAFITGVPFHQIWALDMRQKSPAAVRLVPSTSWEQNADISPDGKRIAFQSGRSGVGGSG